MGLFNDWFVTGDDSYTTGMDDSIQSSIEEHVINPATGLDMVDGIGSVDVGGSQYGMDMHNHDIGFD